MCLYIEHDATSLFHTHTRTNRRGKFAWLFKRERERRLLFNAEACFYDDDVCKVFKRREECTNEKFCHFFFIEIVIFFS